MDFISSSAELIVESKSLCISTSFDNIKRKGKKKERKGIKGENNKKK
jgi:hypothetical protein